MASFIVRVELPGADTNTAKRLDEEMEKLGFAISIPNAQGQLFVMPTGEYFYQGYKTVGHLCALGEEAVEAIGQKAWILAAEIVTVAFDLEPAHV